MRFTHGNILAVFFQATILERLEGNNWYDQARLICCELNDKYPINQFEAVAGVIAALSPNNRWERNVKDAEALIFAFSAGLNLEEVKVSTFNKNKQKAIAILKGAEPLDILGGRKVRAFYECICGDDAVCVDGHAYSIWLGERVSTTKTPRISDSLYDRISDDYRKAAEQISDITGIDYRPCQVQAITWVTWRNLIKKGAE